MRLIPRRRIQRRARAFVELRNDQSDLGITKNELLLLAWFVSAIKQYHLELHVDTVCRRYGIKARVGIPSDSGLILRRHIPLEPGMQV